MHWRGVEHACTSEHVGGDVAHVQAVGRQREMTGQRDEAMEVIDSLAGLYNTAGGRRGCHVHRCALRSPNDTAHQTGAGFATPVWRGAWFGPNPTSGQYCQTAGTQRKASPATATWPTDGNDR